MVRRQNRKAGHLGRLDANKDGVVTFEEFSKAYAKLEKEIAATIPKPAPVPPTPPIGIPEPCLGCGFG